MNRTAIGSAIGGFLIGGVVMLLLNPTAGSGQQETNIDTIPKVETSHHSMPQMSVDLTNLSGDNFDAAFLDGMIEHHKGALEMANQAKSSAKHEELKIMADQIIRAQQDEIVKMQQWKEDWGY